MTNEKMNKENLEKKIGVKTLVDCEGDNDYFSKTERGRLFDGIKDICDINNSKVKKGPISTKYDTYLANYSCVYCADDFGTRTKIREFAKKNGKPVIETYLINCLSKDSYGKKLYIQIYDGKNNAKYDLTSPDLWDRDSRIVGTTALLREFLITQLKNKAENKGEK
jgi:hypothetical protein